MKKTNALAFATCYGEWEYPSKKDALSRYHFLCWWVEFLDNCSSTIFESIKDRSEHKCLKDYFPNNPDRVFNPKSVFDVL